MNKQNQTPTAKCPCCGESLQIEVNLQSKDFSLPPTEEQIKQALKKSGIELAIGKGGEKNE